MIRWVPRQLRTRIVMVVIAVSAAVGISTAWLVSREAEQALRDSSRQGLATDIAVYQTLIDYARTHRSWSGAGPQVAELSKQYGRRVALTDDRLRILVDSDLAGGGSSRSLPAKATARIDAATPFAETSFSDSLLASPETIDAAVACLTTNGIPFTMLEVGGRSIPQELLNETEERSAVFLRCTSKIRSSSAQLDIAPAELVACLAQRGVTASVVDGVVELPSPPATDAESGNGPTDDSDLGFSDSAADAIEECQLQIQRANTAPPVLLFFGTGAAGSTPFSGPGLTRLATILAAVLFVAVLLAWWLGRRLTRRLSQLTAATATLAAGNLNARLTPTDDEIGSVGRAFNALADSLQRNEMLRQQMVSDISHELRNPLVTLGGTLEAIEDGIYQADPATIATLSSEVSRLTGLVGDLHQLAVADAGGLTVEDDIVDVRALCAEAVVAHQHSAGALGVTIELDTTQVDGPAGSPSGAAPPAVLVCGDGRRLRQVLDNLINNALRHTEPGDSIVVAVRHDGFSVIDTGEGIAEADLPFVFDRLWRADKSRQRTTGGSGLGLAIVQALVEAHGGTVSITSRLGEGTSVTAGSLTKSRD